MQRLLQYIYRYRIRYALGVGCLLATASLAMCVPYLLKRAVDSLSAPGHGSVTYFAIAIIVIAIVQGLARTLSRTLIFNVGRDVEFDLRNDLFAHLQTLSASYYQSRRTGDLMSRLVNDVAAVRLMLGPGILNLVNTPIYYVYGLAIMLSLDARLTLVALLPYPILLLVVKGVSRRLMDYTLNVQSELGKMSSHVQENLAGMATVRAYAAAESEVDSFQLLNERFKAESMKLARVRGQLMPVMRSAASLGTLVVLWYGGLLVIRGELSLGDLVAFLGYLSLLAWPTMAMGWMLSIVQRGRAALIRLDEIFAVEADIRDDESLQPVPPLKGEIEFRDVHFAYPDAPDKEVLRGVSFRSGAGAKLGIVGRTGSGKSTITDLLLRLFDPTSGEILVDGHPLKSIPLEQLRKAIGYVPQDPFLFSRGVEENISFGDPGATEARVREAIEVAGMAGELERFPKGGATEVGERGVMLSGGQRQRLTLARAIVTDKSILVFDDSLSSVDARTEQGILKRLSDQLGGRSSVFVTHRVSAIQDSDAILVVDEGRVVEAGGHQSLLARGGLYSEFARRQRLEEEIDRI